MHTLGGWTSVVVEVAAAEVGKGIVMSNSNHARRHLLAYLRCGMLLFFIFHASAEVVDGAVSLLLEVMYESMLAASKSADMEQGTLSIML